MTQIFVRRLPSVRLGLIAVTGAVLLAGCQKQGGDVDPADRASDDPALSGALADKIAVDPARTGDQGAALAANGDDGSVPPVQRSPDAIAAALGEARAQVGGTLQPAPAPQVGSAAALAGQAATAAQVAGNAKLGKVDCSKAVKYSATWAAKLPSELPVFPRGAVQEAAGTDEDGCALRVVNFVTPVSVNDVLGYYNTRAARAGYGVQARTDGEDHVLGGSKGSRAYVVYVRKQDNGLTGVDLVTSGK